MKKKQSSKFHGKKSLHSYFVVLRLPKLRVSERRAKLAWAIPNVSSFAEGKDHKWAGQSYAMRWSLHCFCTIKKNPGEKGHVPWLKKGKEERWAWKRVLWGCSSRSQNGILFLCIENRYIDAVNKVILWKEKKVWHSFWRKSRRNLYLCRRINRNLCASRMQSQVCLSYAEAKPSIG